METKSGAGRSKGKTSWTSQAELSDYSTFIGFFYYFLTELYPTSHEEPRQDAENQSSSQSSVVVAKAVFANSSTIPLIVAGYSYGAFIAINLPPISLVLGRLVWVAKGTAEATIRLRALDLASQFKREVQLHETVQRDSLHGENIPLNLSAPEETGVGATSHDGEASSSVTKDGQIHRATKKSVRWTQDAEEKVKKTSFADLPVIMPTDVPAPVTYYFFVSPLVPPVSTFLTMGKRLYKSQSHIVHKLLYNTSTVVLGGNDLLTSEKSLKKWFSKIKLDRGDKEGMQKLQYEVIEGAGHFWKEEGKERLLMNIVGEFVTERVESSGTKAERTAAWAKAVAEETPGYGPTGLETVEEERSREAAATASVPH
ncbi:MAG: hypothetical protein LQ342_005742 [Letrouitia transgressa]|nr:MAG: hypothetical protein LQ342_005742 [Letrouitia transgressa]